MTEEMETSELMLDLSIVKTEYFEVEDNEPQFNYKPPYSGKIVESGLVEIHTADSTTDRSGPKTPTDDTKPNTYISTSETTSVVGVTSSDESNYFGNKIILGFKKTKSKSVNNDQTDILLKHEKRCFETQLVLKNWGDYLDNSNTYCHDCLILFATVNSLDYHKMTCHSHLVAIDEVKKVQSDNDEELDDDEPHTKRLKTNPIDNVSTKQHRYHIINQTNKQYKYNCKICSFGSNYSGNVYRHYKKVHMKISNFKSTETCVVCNTVVSSQAALIEHMYDKHYKKRFDCSICSKEFDNKKDLEDHLYNHAKDKFIKKHNLNNSPIVNNVIQLGNKPVTPKLVKAKNKINQLTSKIQCQLCKLKFDGTETLRQHVNSCPKRNLQMTEITQKDTPIASNFTQLGTTKKVVKKPNLVTKLGKFGSYNCRYCKKRFVKAELLRTHLSVVHQFKYAPVVKSFSGVSTWRYKCKLCDRVFERHRLCKMHLINVHNNFDDDNNIIMVKQKREHWNVLDNNIVALNHIFKCNICDLHFSNYLQARYHKKHENLKPVQCDVCHLNFAEDKIEIHSFQHRLSPGKEFEVVETNGTIKLRCSLFSKCIYCDTYYSIIGFDGHIRSHMKNDLQAIRKYPEYYCHICKVTLCSRIQDSHTQNHKNNVNFIFVKYELVDLEKIEINKTEAVSLPKATKDPPADTAALLEKYNKITPTWNILFLCSVCELTSDTYTHLVEHSQSHLIGRKNTNTIRNCNICNLKFDDNSFSRHYSLHITNNNINRQSFSIAKYHYSWLAKTTGFTLIFQNLPINNPKEFVSNSIYRRIRNVIFEVIKDGDPEVTSYICHNCKKVVNESYIIQHMAKFSKGQCKRKLKTVKSRYCNLLFPHPNPRNSHDDLHISQPNLQCRVVTFNKPSDQKANTILRGLKGYMLDSNIKTLYKCRDCELCMSVATVSSHLKLPYDCRTRTHELYPCSHCDLKFSRTNIFRHLSKHESPNFTRDSIDVILFDKKSKLVINDACPTDDDTASVSEDNETADPVDKINKEPDQISKAHMKKYTMYRCKMCWRCVINRYDKHVCSSASNKNCGLCNDLAFSPKSYKIHTLQHKNNPDFNLQNINIINFNPKDIEKINVVKDSIRDDKINAVQDSIIDDKIIVKKDSSIRDEKVKEKDNIKRSVVFVIFKCKDCGACFLKAPSAKRHKCVANGTRKCPKCGLLISRFKFNMHCLKHKTKPNFNRRNFKIVIFDRNIPFDNYTKISKTQFDPEELFVFFECSQCSVLCKSRQSAFKHAHRCTGSINSVSCKVCKYKFRVSHSYTKHLARHKMYPNMTRASMTIIKFDKNGKILEETKRKGEDISNIDISENTYNFYQCRDCDMCTHTKEKSKEHTKQECTKKVTLECPICNLWFTKSTLQNTHRKFHKSVNIDVDSLNFIPFDPVEDPEKITVYQCATCKLCLHSKLSTTLHRHENDIILPRNDNVNCCGFVFSRTQFYTHHKKLHEDLNFNRENLKLEIFTPTPMVSTPMVYKEDKNVYKLYKCAICERHFPTQNNMACHKNICNVKYSPKPLKCATCKLNFTITSLKAHKALKCTKKKANNYEIVLFNNHKKVTKKTTEKVEYKCDKCSEVFMTKAALKLHTNLDHIDGEVDCLFCGSTFNMSILNTVHLNETAEGVTCCICKQIIGKGEIVRHAESHVINSD